MGTITGKLVGCQVDGRLVSVPGLSLTAVTTAAGDFEIQNVPIGSYILTVDLGSARRQIASVTVSEDGQDPSVLDLVIDDLGSDNDNCGACGNVCGAGASCLAGVCAEACTPGVPCTAGLGICAAGTRTCNGPDWVCMPNNSPQPETCNGLDDNCDGQVDERDLCADGQVCSVGRCLSLDAFAEASSAAASTDRVRRKRTKRF